MPEAMMVRRPDGLFELLDDESIALKTFKTGEVAKVSWKAMRNGRFFRKWWILARLIFEIWCERGVETYAVDGIAVERCFEGFREELTIMAGYFYPVYDMHGGVRLKAKSISWGEMKEDEFNKFYTATIRVALKNIIPRAGYTEDQLRNVVNEMVRFA